MSTVPLAAVPIEKIKQAMRAGWMAGDFGVVARTISGGAERFIEGLPINAGTKVLDVATGTGNVALPAARRGAVVTGVDIAPNLIEQARQRARDEGLFIHFDEGDAEALPYGDASFDVVVSMFGAMFAPRPAMVASELARVLKPGGLLAMANWNPASFSGRMFDVGARFAPPPPGLPSPVQWGDEAIVRERLSPFFTKIETGLVPILFDMPTSPAGAAHFFLTYFGPTRMAFSRLDGAGQAAFSSALENLWSGANTATDPESHVLVPNEFLRVTAVRATA